MPNFTAILSLVFALGFHPYSQNQDQDKKQEPTTVNLPGQRRPAGLRTFLGSAGLKEPRLMLQAYNDPIDPPKLSPKLFSGQHWSFPWHTDGYVKVQLTDNQMEIRLRVFSQSHDEQAFMKGNEISILTTRELLRLWEFNANRLGIDHSLDVQHRMVDVYLCEKGEPGGEQLFDTEEENGKTVKVNTIYIYDLPSLNDNLEEAREVAHEYGHAVLPAVGGFDKPEYWANGYLGEKLFLRWLRDAILRGDLTPDDAMGASLEDLDHFVVTSVNPLVKEAAKRAPSSPVYLTHTASGMAAFEGAVLWADMILPPKIFGRSLMLLNGNSPLDYINAAVLAAEEGTYEPKFPAYAVGPVWIPVGDGKVTGAEVIKKDSGWMLIKPTGHVKVTAAIDH